MARARANQDGIAARARSGDEPEAGLVPSRRQYFDLKRQHPGAILLYRLGDFYETFDEDARVVARDARITLTSRSFGRSGRAPMAGIPHHALNHYLARLLAAGHTVAIAEQMTSGRSRTGRAGGHPRRHPRHRRRTGAAAGRREPLPRRGPSPRRAVRSRLGRCQHRRIRRPGSRRARMPPPG